MQQCKRNMYFVILFKLRCTFGLKIKIFLNFLNKLQRLSAYYNDISMQFFVSRIEISKLKEQLGLNSM